MTKQLDVKHSSPRDAGPVGSYCEAIDAWKETKAGIEREALSIAEWCEANSLSKAFFYKLAPDMRPKVLRIGRRRIITREASAEWRRRMEAQTADGIA